MFNNNLNIALACIEDDARAKRIAVQATVAAARRALPYALTPSARHPGARGRSLALAAIEATEAWLASPTEERRVACRAAADAAKSASYTGSTLDGTSTRFGVERAASARAVSAAYWAARAASERERESALLDAGLCLGAADSAAELAVEVERYARAAPAKADDEVVAIAIALGGGDSVEERAQVADLLRLVAQV